MREQAPRLQAGGVRTPAVTLRIGTRGSALAVAQTSTMARELERITGESTELVRVTTHGDVTRAALSSLGGTGVFASELRDALLAGECDLVVHSLKDLPTAKAPGLTVAAYPVREDQRDALCSLGGASGLTLEQLPHGAKVGTGSPRRVAQLLTLRPDLEIRDIRGNVERRLRFVTDGELDAVVLAAAGLERLGFAEAITERFDLETFPNAPGQGCLAIEVRDGETPAGVSRLDDPAARAAVLVERGILATLEAGCAAPVGASARYADGKLEAWATVYAVDGSSRVSSRRAVEVSDPRALDAAQAELVTLISTDLFDQGALALMA
ncbi:hydroxymethylbilane synthase [Pseudoclavibacter sp. RFBA6]|nr:hydroxymethylbilane synthase [Pseudoclavibacter sp. RFBA6]